MVPQDDSHTGHEEVVPWHLTVSKHPRQGRQRIRTEAGTFETGPANGVGHQYGGDTKSPPGPLRGRHRGGWLRRANGGGHRLNKGRPKRGRAFKKSSARPAV